MKMSATTVLTLCLLAAVCGCRRDKTPMTPTPPPWLDTAVQEQVQQQGPDTQLLGSIFKGTAFREDQSSEWQVTLEAGQCYWFSGAGDQTVEELYLQLRDPEDDEVADDSNDTPRIVITHCPEVSGMFTLRAKVTEGHGHYAVGVYGKPTTAALAQPTAAPVDTGTAQPSGTGLGGVVDEMAKASAPDAQRVGNHLAGATDRSDWYVALESGKCYWFIGAGDAGVVQLTLTLWAPPPGEKQIALNQSENNRVTVGHCPANSGMFHIQAKVDGGEGKYMVGVFAKKK